MTARSLIVLKFGGSVLIDTGSIVTAVNEVSRFLNAHDRILAVVSAFRGGTDALERTALGLCADPAPETLAYYMGLGELRAAGELALGLQGAGIPATVRLPWDVSLVSSGSPLDATPVSVSRQAFADAFATHRVVVFPGFVSRGEDGRPHVLGRGGSDLTAVYLASELRADRCVLLKDTPGVFELDPVHAGWSVRRYRTLSWDDAARLGGRVMPASTVAFARSRRMTFEVTAIGEPRTTVVGAETSQFDPPAEGHNE